MIPYKKISLDTDFGSDELLTRLNWQTDHTENLLFPKTNTLTSTSKRPLIGISDNKSQRFILTRLRPFFETYFPQYFIKGHIQKVKNGVVIRLKFTPGLFTTVILLFLMYTLGLILWNLVKTPEDKELLKSFFWILVIALVTVLLSIRELNKITNLILTILKMKIKNNR